MRVLIVRFSAIGDCVMAAWAATAIRNQHPDAVIGWAVESRCAPVIDTDRLVNELCVFPREKWKQKRGSPSVFFDQIRTYLGLRKHRFDLAIDLQGHSKTALATKLSGTKTRLSARATDALASRLNPVLLPSQQPGEHEVELYARALREFGLGPIPVRPIMPRLEPVELPFGPPFVTIQTGAGEADKRVPIETWSEVAVALQTQNIPVVALGGPKDPKLEVEGVFDGVGRWSLRESMAVLQASQVHLAGDTGSGHLAAALDVPVVSVFGRTDPSRFRPWTERGTTLRHGKTPAETPGSAIIEAAQTWLREVRAGA